MRIKPSGERLWLYLSGGLLLLTGLGLRALEHPQALIASSFGLGLILLGLILYWRSE